MSRELLIGKYNTDIIIGSETYKVKNGEDAPIYKQRIRSINIFVVERDQSGVETGLVKKIWLEADDVLKIAEKINQITSTPGREEDYNEDDLPF